MMRALCPDILNLELPHPHHTTLLNYRYHSKQPFRTFDQPTHSLIQANLHPPPPRSKLMRSSTLGTSEAFIRVQYTHTHIHAEIPDDIAPNAGSRLSCAATTHYLKLVLVGPSSEFFYHSLVVAARSNILSMCRTHAHLRISRPNTPGRHPQLPSRILRFLYLYLEEFDNILPALWMAYEAEPRTKVPELRPTTTHTYNGSLGSDAKCWSPDLWVWRTSRF